MTTQTRTILRQAELDSICEAARTDWTQGVVMTLRVFGVDLTDPNIESVAPWDYAIPEDQWEAICEACMGDPESRDPLSAVNHGLDWMNFGPSGFRREEIKS